MSDHVIKTCFYHLSQLKCIQSSLQTSIAIQLVTSFVISLVDYCNSILAGLSKYELDRIQSILNVVARLILGQDRHDHATPLLRNRLHWLWVPQRIKFKCCLLVYKALNGLTQTTYPVIVSTCQQTIDVPVSIVHQKSSRHSAAL